MQADPLGLGAADPTNPQILNLYTYVENDPANNIDPLGVDVIAVTTCVTMKLEGEVISINCETTYYFTGFGPIPVYESGFGGGAGVFGGGGTSNSQDDKALPNAYAACGVGASIGEYTNVIGDKWKGNNNKWYSKLDFGHF